MQNTSGNKSGINLFPPVGVEGEQTTCSHPGPAPVRSTFLSDLSVEKLSRHHPRQDAQTDKRRKAGETHMFNLSKGDQ